MASFQDPHDHDSHEWTGEPDAPAAAALIAALAIAALIFFVIAGIDFLS